MSVVCLRCRQPTASGAHVCGDCGAPLPIPCPVCGLLGPPGKRFCGDCGSPLTVPASPLPTVSTPASLPLQPTLPILTVGDGRGHMKLEGENRSLTILFADLTASVQTTAHLHHEDAAALVNSVLTMMVEAVLALGGHINQLLGDGVLAFFGTPQAHEDDPERAVRAALQIRQAVQARGLDMTAGINAGEVYLGAMGAAEYSEVHAVGAVINLAARLQQKAHPGQILVGEGVYRAARGAFAFARHQVDMKGFPVPVAAYEVVGERARPEKIRGIDGLPAGVVGRDEELAALAEAVMALRRGHGRMVALIGDAGVGKSRLIADVKTRALALDWGQPPLLLLEGQCLAVSMAVSYGPFRDMLRGYLAWETTDDERMRGDHLAMTLQGLVARGALAAGRAEEIGPLVSRALSLGDEGAEDKPRWRADAEQVKRATLLALRDLLLALSAGRSLILILDDLHWADNLSLELITLLMDSVAHAPVLMFCAYRNDGEHACHDLGRVAAQRCGARYTELQVRELAPAPSRRLIELLLPGDALPSSVTALILQKAQGNPFFLEEIVRALIDAGMVYPDGGQWRAHADIAAVTVPTSIQAVILSRVDRLSAEARRVLRSAAVIGRLFRRRLLAQLVHAHDDAGLDGALRELEERALIHLERAAPEEEYSFRHVLAQDTVYRSLLRGQRAASHRRVAEALEQIDRGRPEENCVALAHHYARSDTPDRAVPYLEQAGDQAAAHYALAAAESHYREATGLLTRLGQDPAPERLREKLAGTLSDLSRYGESLEMLREVAHTYQTAGDVAAFARSLSRLAEVHAWSGSGDEGIRYLQPLLAAIEPAAPRDLIPLYRNLSALHFTTGGYHEALALAEQAIALARASGDDHDVGGIEFHRGNVLGALGRVRESLRAAEEALHAGAAANDLILVCAALINVAFCNVVLGHVDTALDVFAQSRDVAERVGQPNALILAVAWDGWALFLAGRWAQAREAFERAVAISRASEGCWGSAYALLGMGQLLLAEGRRDEAARYLSDAIGLAEPTGDLQALRWASGLRAELDVLQGRPEAALTRLEPLLDRPGMEEYDVTAVLPVLALAHLRAGDAVRAADIVVQATRRARPDARLVLVDALRVRALVAIEQGNWREAYRALDEGVAVAREMPYPHAEARLRQAYAEAHTRVGHSAAALEHLETAQAIFNRLGARKDAEVTERAIACVALARTFRPPDEAVG